MASPHEPPFEDVLARQLGTYRAHRLFQDLEIAFQWLRSLEEKAYRQETVVASQLSQAIATFEAAHAAWRDFVMRGVTRDSLGSRLPEGDRVP